MKELEDRMLTRLRRLGFAAAMTVAIAGTTVALPGAAQARWGGGGWGWGGVGLGIGTGLLLGAALAAPYYGGYGYGPAYGYGCGPYYGGCGYGAAYGYGYGPYYASYGAPYGGGCFVTRRWVTNAYGHRVWRRVRVCG